MEHLGRLGWSFLWASMLLACGPAEPPTPAGVDRAAMLAATAERVIAPGYVALAASMATLEARCQALEAAPDAGALAEAQAAWRAARAPRASLWGLWFGPAESMRLTSALDWWPVDAEDIDALVRADTPVDASLAASLGAAERGLMAMELLLFDSPLTPGGALAALQEAELGPRRRALLTAWAAYGKAQAEAVSAAWGAPGDGAYTDVFSAPGPTNEVYPRVQDALDDLVNGLVHGAQVVAERQLGGPLGLKSGGVPDPEAVQGAFSDQALADARSLVGGISAAWGVAEGAPSLSDVVREVSPAADDAVRADLAAVDAALAAVPMPLEDAVSLDPASVERAYQRAKDLERDLTVDVAGALGVTLTFGDNDGD